MAQKDTGEERNIWPGPRRIMRLRREGQVPLSRDFQTALTMLAIVAYILIAWRSMIARLQAGFLIIDPAMPGGFVAEANRVIGGLGRLALETLGPIAAVAMLGALVGAMLDAKGFVLQVKALAPDFGRLSPAEGLKRMFSLKNLLELVKGLIVITVVIGANVLLFRALYNDLMWAPSCGLPCAFKMLHVLIGGSIAIGLVVMLATAFADLPLSRWQFRRENRMSISEFKRDQKDDEGDPDIRRERRRQAKEAAEAARHTGLNRASVIMVSGTAAVAITYKAGDTPAPVVAARTTDAAAGYMRRAAELGIPVVQEPELVARLLDSAGVGSYVPQACFNDVARVLITCGVIGR